MAEPLISIIIPVYNAAAYITEAIHSANQQTWNNKEIIIIDDGSTDGSYEIAKKHESDRIKIIRLPINVGQSCASNVGFLNSQGNFIKFLDADDIIPADFLSVMMDSVVSEDDMYFSNCASFIGDFDLRNIKQYDFQINKTMAPLDFLLDPISNMQQGGRWLIPRRVIERAGLWNEQLSLINDFEYFTRLCLNSNHIHLIPDASLYYRHVENSISTYKSNNALDSAFLSIKLAGQQLLEKEDSRRVRLYIANCFQGLLHMFYPRHLKVLNRIEKEITELGGSTHQLDGGKIFLKMNNIFGWKVAKLIQYWVARIKLYLR